MKPVLIRTALVAGVATAATLGLATGVGPAGASPSQHSSHTIIVQGVRLTVPKGWHVTAHRGSHPACVVDPDAPKSNGSQDALGQSDCQLQILVGRRIPSYASPDRLYFTGDPAQCVRHDRAHGWHSVAASKVRVGDARAEYRRLANRCLTAQAEQWFVVRAPAVLIQRTWMNPDTEQAARRAVASARLPHGHGFAGVYDGAPDATR